MKKIIYLIIAVLAVGLYSCQKENTAPKNLNGIMKAKKDTTPPDFRRLKRDTTPPDLYRSSAQRDTTPPDLTH
ncbi:MULTISPECIES: hypothetical protein [unclassified Mucilaginibacter]|uniref:hypothetical protein n=1 Tax=unclassified Mucilaginibacter TaxID=2617802 RepID=UPI00095B70E8|nr:MULTISPECIES: hypothetical protein [unclassified Mucilaginibacter]OJW18035.1 MAG: hypothetical protein BGO48_15770 [Mucilaginibacter sp. 44-25]PLW91436.1 MAG: hypothetical protein C0154_01225 [Mucilaginibacter sp.]HEK21442.1 hypothetical protein [Bacteroidota bacterium]